MNKLLSIVACLLTLSVFAQTPQKLSYQAVIRDNSNNLLENQTVGMQISILQNSTPIYSETHTTATNTNGLVTIEIGTGTTNDSFNTIDWSTGPFFVKTETDPTGGTNYTISGTSQLLSVPYALYAESAANVFSGNFNSLNNIPAGLINGDDDTQLTESQVDAFVANNNFITTEIDGSTTNEIQNLESVLGEGNSANNNQIRNLAEPTASQDAATKQYVDKLETRVQLMESMLIEAGLLNEVADVDGNIYGIIKIGNQYWLDQNLKTTKYNDCTPIPLVTDNSQWENLTTPAYSWYNNDQVTYEEYGILYNFYTVETNKVCPIGWHVPAEDEWQELQTFLGGTWEAGKKIKETGTQHWVAPNDISTNETGFTALPAGSRENGIFNDITRYGYFWSTWAEHPSTRHRWELRSTQTIFAPFNVSRDDGYSIRCLKN